MASYRNPCRTIREGPVQVIYGKHNHKKRYLKAECGSTEGIPARLQLYEDNKSASKGKSLMCEILFTDVAYVNSTEERHKKVVTIGMLKDCKSFSFYVADSHTSTLKWFKYCGLLFAIPHYAIPEVPKENLVLQNSINQRKDCYKSVSSWVVYILSEGIGDSTGFIGLHVVTICDSTFNIYDFHTDKHLIAWPRDKIKRSGYIESLVFLEVDETCCGGPGILWMQHPIPQAITLQQNLHEFIFFDPEQNSCKRTSLACHILVDSAMSNTYIKGGNNPQLFHEEPPSQSSLFQQDASQSSLDSQCSSGYCSDASSWAGSHGGSFRLHQLKSTHKSSDKKQSKDHEIVKSKETLSDQVACSSKDDNKHIRNGHENSSIQNYSSYENCSPLNLQKTPPLPPKPCRKPPLYENHTITALKPNATSERSNSFPSSVGPTSGHCTGRSMSSSSCQQAAVLSTQSPESTVSGTEHTKRFPLVTTATISKHQLEKQAFQNCSVIITDHLDISAILPHLNAHGLLADKDLQTLLNQVITNVEKAHYLLDILPRKDSGFFETFIFCLCQSKNGTGHGDIVKALTASFKKVKESNIVH